MLKVLQSKLGKLFTSRNHDNQLIIRMIQITLSGFGFVVINLLTMFWYNPGLDQDCPPWVYASWAIGLFLYQTFDAVDGSQA